MECSHHPRSPSSAQPDGFFEGGRTQESSEVYDMMNVLEPCLSHANSAVVLATVRVFLRLTLCMPEVHQQVAAQALDPPDDA